MRILNLGAGVQSTAVLLMAEAGELPTIDHAIFADTGEEPDEVYRHLEWLKSVCKTPIHVATKGKLGDDLLRGENSTGQRFASIPCFTAKLHTERQMRESCNQGMVPRQCTKEYKIEVIERTIRRVILGLGPRQRMPHGVSISQMFGISEDERRRAKRIRERYESIPWANVSFPLLDLQMTREDCKRWLADRVPHETPRSACVFCPYKSATEWQRTKDDQGGRNRSRVARARASRQSANGACHVPAPRLCSPRGRGPPSRRCQGASTTSPPVIRHHGLRRGHVRRLILAVRRDR